MLVRKGLCFVSVLLLVITSMENADKVFAKRITSFEIPALVIDVKEVLTGFLGEPHELGEVTVFSFFHYRIYVIEIPDGGTCLKVSSLYIKERT